jgi:hypothetical protein
MKHNGKLLFISSAAAIGMGLTLVMSGSLMTNAATFRDTSFTDSFGNGVDETLYTRLNDSAETKKFTFVDKPGQLKMTGFDYANGYVHTKNKIEVPTGKSLVVQYDVISDGLSASAGGIGLAKGGDTYADAWGDMVYYNAAGNRIWSVSAPGSGYQAPGGAGPTSWAATNAFVTNSMMRQVWNADGSAEFYGAASTDATALAKYFYFNAGDIKKTGTGYVGFVGNGCAGLSLTIDNFKVGYCDSATATDSITWSLEDNFDTADNWTVEAAASATVEMGTSKYLMADNPDDGAGLVYNTKFDRQGNAITVVDAALNLNVSELTAGKTIGLSCGLADDATNAASGNFIGVAAKADGSETLDAYVGGELKKSVDVTTTILNSDATLRLSAGFDSTGAAVVTGTLGTIQVSVPATSVAGRVGIAVKGTEGSVKAKILGLAINNFKEVLETGRDLTNDFSKALNKNWFTKSTNAAGEAEADHVYVKDGVLRFDKAGDGSLFTSKYKYANFDLSFDAKMQQYEEDEAGNITAKSTWIGVSMGRKNVDDFFAAESNPPMVYINDDTVNPLNIVYTGARTWLPDNLNFMKAANKDVMLNVHIKALNGTVSVAMKNPADAAETVLVTYDNVNTDGYVAIVCTAGGNFTIDNYAITNLDGNGAVNAVPVVTDYAKTVVAGETLTDKVEGTDADGDALTYEVVEDKTAGKGVLTFNPDGTYTFVANAAATKGSVSFTYRATDTEDYSEAKTVTIAVTEKEVPATSSTPATSTPAVTSTPATSASTGSNKGCGGCGGSVVGAIGVSVVALGGVLVLAARKKHND